MTYDEAVSFIHSLLKFGMNLGLERITALLEMLGNPQNDMKFIHVAGTNGKGTSSTMMSQILKSAGYKTGLFTSPYVFSFCERIQIDNKNIDKQGLANITACVKDAIVELHNKGIEVTEFEAITAIALVYFKQQKCDYAVMEVGLGGRLDSTNIIPCPEVAIITSISMDHMNVLGDTIEKIAEEKCGIIKNGGRIVTTSLQNENALRVIENTVKEKNASLTVATINDVKIINQNTDGTDFIYKNQKIHISLLGSHQIENTIGVIEAAKLIGIDDKSIIHGIANTVMHGRMEIVSRSPFVLIDGGHNEECSLALKAVVEQYVKGEITAVIGMMADKDCEKYLSNILPLCKRVVFTKPYNPRSEEPSSLKATARPYIDEIYTIDSPKTAYNKALSLCEKGGLVLVCGSFYMLSDIFN